MQTYTTIDQLIDYIEKRSPGFENTIAGASEEKINLLADIVKQASGCNLSLEYKAFLKYMGGKETSFPFMYDASAHIDDVIEKHQQLLEDKEGIVPGSFFIAVHGAEVEEIALSCEDGKQGLREGTVFIPDGDVVRQILAESFMGYLFSQAFKYCVGSRAPYTATFTGTYSKESWNLLVGAAEKHQLVVQPFSDAYNLCATNSDESLTLYALQKPNQTVWIRISGNDKNSLETLKTDVDAVPGITFERWW